MGEKKVSEYGDDVLRIVGAGFEGEGDDDAAALLDVTSKGSRTAKKQSLVTESSTPAQAITKARVHNLGFRV